MASRGRQRLKRGLERRENVIQSVDGLFAEHVVAEPQPSEIAVKVQFANPVLGMTAAPAT